MLSVPQIPNLFLSPFSRKSFVLLCSDDLLCLILYTMFITLLLLKKQHMQESEMKGARGYVTYGQPYPMLSTQLVEPFSSVKGG